MPQQLLYFIKFYSYSNLSLNFPKIMTKDANDFWLQYFCSRLWFAWQVLVCTPPAEYGKHGDEVSIHVITNTLVLKRERYNGILKSCVSILCPGQRRRPRRPPRGLRGRGLGHRGPAAGRGRPECQEQAQADATAHRRQQGPPPGGQNPAGLWLSPQPPGMIASPPKRDI